MKYLLIVLFLFAAVAIKSEIIYLNDGQIIEGSIEEEKTESILVKTKYQKRWIRRDHITRIMYGNRKMEKVYILKKNGELINGFLVDQTSESVTYRKTENSPDEIVINKSEIKQLSQDEITQYDPYISIKFAVINPLNSGGGDLSSCYGVLAGFGVNFPLVNNMRLLFEAGYFSHDSDINKDLTFDVIPVTVSGLYQFNPGSVFGKAVRIVPFTGIGLSIIDARTGEGEQFKGYDFTFLSGCGIEIDIIPKTLSLGLYGEYRMIYETNAIMHNALLNAGINYYL